MTSRHADLRRMQELQAVNRKLEEDLRYLRKLDARRRQEAAKHRHEDLKRWEENMDGQQRQDSTQHQQGARCAAEGSKLRQEEERAKRRQQGKNRTRRRSRGYARAFDEDATRRQPQYPKAKEQAEAETRRRALVEAWNKHEKRWAVLQSMPSLTFISIPWPVVSNINRPDSLLPRLIAEFILSPAHSQTQSRKRRIHAALTRWHPDRFDAKFLHKVVEEDRKAVEEGVGKVVRCLNGILATEGACKS